MGTNYDWTLAGVPDKHIGKVSALGEGRTAFIWAADPVQTMELLHMYEGWRGCIIDEYGHEHTPRGMISIITGCIEQDYSSVGQEFS